MGKRRRAREIALQHLYQWDFHGPGPEELAQIFSDGRGEPERVLVFVRQLVDGVKQRQEQIDALIESQSRHWKIYRMSRVDRNVLRIAVFELTSCLDIPPKVSIDEAIELGKKFGSEDSGAFINGILDQLSRRLGRMDADAGGADAAKETPDEDPSELDAD